MKKFEKFLSRPWAAYAFAACSAVVLYLLLTNISVFTGWFKSVWKLLSPVVIGIVVAYLLDPVHDFFYDKVFFKIKKHGVRHMAAVVTTVTCIVLVLAILLVALIPSLAESVTKLIMNWKSYTDKAESLIEKLAAFTESRNINIDYTKIYDWVDNSMSKVFGLLKNNVQTIFSVIGSVSSSVSNFAVGLLFGVCFLVAEDNLIALIARVRPAFIRKERLERNNGLFRRFNSVFLRYVGCTLLDALIIGMGTLVFTLAMRMPYATLIAAVCALTNIIPTFGPMIGAAVGVFFLILDKPLNALWFLIFICVWQSVDGMIIKPKLFKDSLGIPGVWTLVLIILGGKFAGMLGILLAIPFAAIMVIIYKEYIVPRLEKRRLKINVSSAAGTQQDVIDANDEVPEDKTDE
ncbi:MAG: AI-2E family transporter [Clostridia bacterium]|nr:AI-2E family transporter [Clostridia bacterium]